MDLSASALGTDVNTYEINQFGALGILAKLYLNAEIYSGTPRFAEAAMAASYIIDSGVYSLCGAGCAAGAAELPSVRRDSGALIKRLSENGTIDSICKTILSRACPVERPEISKK